MYNNYSPEDVQSFFQIGGIHGRPYVAYDGATVTNEGGKFLGYCTHGTVLFPTWHRPYVLLFEQVLQKRAQEIACRYQVDTPAWKEAARAIRQPYWDWAAHAVPPPEVISMERVTITDMNGVKRSIENPLYRYTFPPVKVKLFNGNFRNWPATLRRPMSADPSAQSNVKELIEVLQKDAPNIQASTYSMLTRMTSWESFSNTKLDTNPSTATSLEGIHNGIHYRVGASAGIAGHMGDNDVAAFDPIFFLHHSNVDRMISLWSALNPGTWVSPGDSSEGTATMTKKAPVDTNTPLTPFWKTNNTFWTSAETVNTQALGYSYPEFSGLDINNLQVTKVAIASQVNHLYGSSGVLPTLGPRKLLATATSIPNAISPSCPDHGQWDWSVRIRVKKFELGSSFQVVVFLGEVPADPKEWHLSTTAIGTHPILVNENRADCANCATQHDFVEQGFLHINRGIMQIGGIQSLDPAIVVEYLTANLRWKVQKIDGSPAACTSLEVGVFCTPLSYPDGALFPLAGEPVHHVACTQARSGEL